MDSSGYVSCLILGPHILRSVPIEHSQAYPRFSQFDFFDRDGIEAPPTGQNKDGVPQCKKHSSPSMSFVLASCLFGNQINFV
jgi:hypothetical protein